MPAKVTDRSCAGAPEPDDLSVIFWGVRGSMPVFGPEYSAFGGSTMCLEVRAGAHRIIVDAGSGLVKLGRALIEEGVHEAHIFLTHFHIDHVLGLLSFAPLFRAGATVTLYAPILDQGAPAALLRQLFGKPFFPLALGETGARFVLRSFRPGDGLAACGFKVATIGLSHPGGSVGYRIDGGGRRVAILVDHEPRQQEEDAALVAFCANADLLLYDAHWDEELNYDGHRGWGHSTWQAGLRLLQASKARRLGCLHHAPAAGDADLKAREARLQRFHPRGFFAREGKTVRLSGRFRNKP